MASIELTSNLKQITSGKVPTTANLANGELAFGVINGVAKLYGNVNGTIVDFSDFLKTAPVTSVNSKTGVVTLTKSDLGLGNVDNVKQYSASNPPPYPVTSVNGQTGAVVVDTTSEPYVANITWTGTAGSYFKTILASTHGKGAYPSVQLWIQEGSNWREAVESFRITNTGNVVIFSNSNAIVAKVVIK